MRFFCFLLVSLILSSCAKDGLKNENTNNPNFEVTFCFEHEGIRVYRFYDDGRYHWFTSIGECINTHTCIINTGKTTYIKNEDEIIK